MDASPAPVSPIIEPDSEAAPPPDLIALVDDYDGLLATIRACISETNATLESIEEAAGLPARYLSKIVGPRHVRHFGPALFHVLGSLGLHLAIVSDSELAARYRDRLEPRLKPRHTRLHWRWWRKSSAA